MALEERLGHIERRLTRHEVLLYLLLGLAGIGQLPHVSALIGA